MKILVLRRERRGWSSGNLSVMPKNRVSVSEGESKPDSPTIPITLPIPVTREAACVLMRHPNVIEPLRDSVAKLDSLLPSLGLAEVERIESTHHPDFPKALLRIVVRAGSPLTPERWMSAWDDLSSAIEEPMRTKELGRRVLVYLDPCW